MRRLEQWMGHLQSIIFKLNKLSQGNYLKFLKPIQIEINGLFSFRNRDLFIFLYHKRIPTYFRIFFISKSFKIIYLLTEICWFILKVVDYVFQGNLLNQIMNKSMNIWMTYFSFDFPIWQSCGLKLCALKDCVVC